MESSAAADGIPSDLQPPTKAADGRARVIERSALSHDISRLVLARETPEVFRYRPGQFINVVVSNEGPRPVYRSYSLAGDPSTPEHLEIWYDSDVEGLGVGTLNRLKVGDEVRFKGPLGIFGLKPPSERERILVAHISAIGTMLRLAEQALEQSPQRVTFLYAPRREDEALGLDRLVGLAERYPQFHPVVTVPEASGAWKGPRRTLLEELLRRIPAPDRVEVYACGLGGLIAQLKGACKERGLSNEQLIFEKWSKAEE